MQGLPKEGECRQLEFWTWKAMSELPILHISKSPETPQELFLEYIKNIGWKKYQRGATHRPRGWGRAPLPREPPGGPLMPTIGYMESFVEEKNHKLAHGTKLRRHEVEPWRNQSRAPAELFCRGNFPLGGGNHHDRHHQWSSHREGVNLHQHLHQHHLLSNPSSSLVSNLVSKTTNWYMWVASSVDYSL